MTTTVTLPLALDLTRQYPRSPREKLGGYLLLARIVDKCRANLNGTVGDYFSCEESGLDRRFFEFTGINCDEFRALLATGADDDAVVKWVHEHSKVKEQMDVIVWNNRVSSARLSDLEPAVQVLLTDFIENALPKGCRIYTVLDIWDIDEGRIVQ